MLIVDIDEVVVPMQHENWEAMLKTVDSDETLNTAYSVTNAFFFDNMTSGEQSSNIPNMYHMLRHPYRSAKLSDPGQYGKSFMETANVVTVFNHFPLHKRLLNMKRTIYLEPELAMKHHYKDKCPIESRDECPALMRRSVFDDSLLKYAKKLMPKIATALKSLKKH